MISVEANEKSHSDECRILLGGLKGIVESLLVVNTTSVWSTVGGLSRLVNQLDKVLLHGLKEEGCDYWPFILKLRQLQPTLAPLVEKLNRQSETRGIRQGNLWLQSSLEQLTVSGQLQILFASGCMKQYYYDHAIVCQPAYTQALLTCLRAIEQNDACLLAELDYSLFQMQRSFTRQDPTFPPQSSFRSLHFQGTSDSEHRMYPPMFIQHSKPDGMVSLSSDHAIGSTPPNNNAESAKDILESVLEVKDHGGRADKTENDDAMDPLMNIQCSDLKREDNYDSSENVRTKPSENGILIRKKRKQDLPTGIITALDSEGFVPPKRIHEALQCHGVVSPRNYLLREDTIMENNAKIFTPSPKENEMQWSQPREGKTKGQKLFGSFSDTEDDPRIVRKLSSAENLQRSGESLNSADYEVSLFKEKSENWEKAIGDFDNFGSVKTRMKRRRKLSTDLAVSHHEKQLKRRNAKHKRWHSEHLTKNETQRILEDAREGYDQTHDREEASSFPDERKWYHGSQSPMVDGYFPQPTEGESLMSFLSSQDFATCPELDRENAHFCISEAIISAVEQIKCKQIRRQSDNESDASDEEIQALRQRIRIRRKERRQDKVIQEDGGAQAFSSPESLSPEMSDLFQLPASESESDFSDTDGLEDLELSDGSNLTSMQDGGLSASLASLYSDADLRKSLSSQGLSNIGTSQLISETNTHLSAESIALSLLKKFSLKHLPRASELEWMVSEKDAPQALLPLPQSVPISPDDGENADLLSLSNKSMRLRGNMEWAPPRAQLIFNIHPILKRKLIIAKQNYRCAGCGMKIERGFLKRLRYCHYLGKYFCQCCHTSNTALIPSRILQKWDFTKMPISNFSLEFLKKIYRDPLFNIGDLNPHLYKKVRTLLNCQELRSQLYSLKDFIRTCRLSDRSLFSLYDQEPLHLLSEVDTYSMADLVRVRSGDMEKTLSKLLQLGVQHVIDCELCQAKGFICEICKEENDVIFPFQLQKTFQCPDCGSCYHNTCFDQLPECPKCVRIKKRKVILAQISESEESSLSNSPPCTPDMEAR